MRPGSTSLVLVSANQEVSSSLGLSYLNQNEVGNADPYCQVIWIAWIRRSGWVGWDSIQHALSLFKLFNSTDYTTEWAALNLNQINTSRQIHFVTGKSNLKRVGLNAIANRYHILNGKIPLNNFNESLDSFKIFCKKKFLTM